jgi:FAD/FMN-containing dehydrogenase/Fe-S oxidoreductase
MTSAQQQALFTASNCEVAFDNLTRQLYATDASIYQIEPTGVAFPKGVRQASAVIEAAAQAGIPVIPRGAGTGLVGGAIGEGLVIDFARHNNQITDLDIERRTVRVGPGVVLDQLNRFLRPHGFRFGPDVATSSRATLGGMIANNSSGSHTPVYGTTADHLNELEIVLADGSVVVVGPKHDTLRKQRELVGDLVYFHALEIRERMPAGLLKRRPGYALARCAADPGNLNHLICGSEGTLAAITSAELKIVPLPQNTGLGLIFFNSVADAMQATVELLDLKPAAIEHIDRVLFDQTAGQLEFKGARALLELDTKPCESILAVEFFDEDAEEKLAQVSKRQLGSRVLIVKSARDATLVWSLRKAGLSLLTGRKGAAKPVTCIEDTAVLPKDLPEYVKGLEQIMRPLGIEASYYGHAAAGLLHVRPVLDLHAAADVEKMRRLSNEVSALVRQFNGSLAGEHGVGIARTEYLGEQLGEHLLNAMAEIKHSFDPHNVLNPGKILHDGRYTIDTNLRQGGYRLELPFEPRLAFAGKDDSFIGNLEQCNGCGGCRKETATMCPTFIVTGDEIMSTRGRANTIRAVLERRGMNGTDPLGSAELETALTNCLSCKACTTECPSNVNMSLLKAELLHARIKRDGLSLRERVFSDVDSLGRLGCRFPRLANFALGSLLVRTVLNKTVGIAWQRPLPPYAKQRFDRWFWRRKSRPQPTRGRVLLWDDTFARYHEPNIAMAAVKVLEAAGFEVGLLAKRKCCGRPAFSQGNLDEAARLGAHNFQALESESADTPILFLEPSCYSMFAEDYLELGLPGATEIAKRCFLFEEFIERLLGTEPNALSFDTKAMKVVIHAHCHAKSIMNPAFMRRLASRLPGRNAVLLDSACCGMAGAFGALASKYELSLKIAEPLMQQLHNLPFGTVVVASGTSCRHQIEHLAVLKVRHMAELLAEALV